MSAPEPKKRLTDLELEIMQVIWDRHPSQLTVRQVVERMTSVGHALAYTTVQTMMNILRKKGVLTSQPGPGRAHEYAACVSRSQARSSMTNDLVERLFLGEAKPLVAHLIDHDSMTRDELESLKRQIELHLSDEEQTS
jgi:BlaI family penicillinase repressor